MLRKTLPRRLTLCRVWQGRMRAGSTPLARHTVTMFRLSLATLRANLYSLVSITPKSAKFRRTGSGTDMADY